MKARRQAHKILIDVCMYKRYSNLALKEDINDFQQVDKALITNIVYGTLQNYRYVRYLWVNLADSFPAEEIALLIDMSIYQLVFMDRVPEYAVINDAVDIAKTLYEGKFEKFVNAVLRNYLRAPRRVVEGGEVDRFATRYSYPTWLVQMWMKQYGKEDTMKICEAMNQAPKQCARVNTLKISKEEVMELDENFTLASLASDALYYAKGNIANSEAFKKGYVTIQDESAQLVCEILDPKPNEAILDMCAAPGSKTCHIGSLMKNKGTLVALDIHEHRVELIKKNARRMGIIMVQALAQDALELEEVFERDCFDRILLDGPCSGYGVIARKSDIKYHMKNNDMDSCIKIQSQLLDSATKYLKVDGVLVYSTCTLNKKENEFQVEAFLKRHKNFTLVEEKTILPFEHHSDGFYMAKLVKTK